MDKLLLINKEIKEYKISLNNLYNDLKQTKDNNKLIEIRNEIEASDYVLNVLKELREKFTNNIGEYYLNELTINNNNQYELFQNRLNIYDKEINIIELSRVSKLARNNIFTSFYNNFISYMKEVDENNTKYYYLYDDENVIVSSTEASWHNKYTCEELYMFADELRNNTNNNISPTKIK